MVLITFFSCTVNKEDIEGITYESVSYVYDGTVKELLVTGDLPELASVVYSNNKRSVIGESKATAVISGPNYNTLILEATLTITALPEVPLLNFTGINFENVSVFYDSNEHYINITGEVPEGTQVIYTSTTEHITNSATEIGIYYVTVNLVNPAYNPLTLHATLEIKEVDSLPFLTDYLFIGDSFIDRAFYKNFDSDFGDIDKVVNLGVGGTRIQYWKDKIDQIEALNPAKIIMHLGINDINAGTPGNQTYLELAQFFNLILSVLPKTQIFYISLNPNTSFTYGASAATLVNDAVIRYAEENNHIVYINFREKMYDGKTLITSFLADGLHLSNNGYILFTKTIKEYLGLPVKEGENFGEVGKLGVSSGVDLSLDKGETPSVTITSFNEQQAFLASAYSTNLFFNVNISQLVKNQESTKPTIAGLVIGNMYCYAILYIDITSSIFKAGIVKKYGEEMIDYSLKQEIQLPSSSSFDFNLLGVRNGKDIYFVINDTPIYKISNYDKLKAADNSSIGIYTSNTKATFTFNKSGSYGTTNSLEQVSSYTFTKSFDLDVFKNNVKNYKIEFGSAKDTGFIDSEEIYANITRNSTSVTYSVLGYGNFRENEVINIVMSNIIIPKNNWNMSGDNIYVKVLSDGQVYFKTNQINMFEYSKVTDGTYLKTIPISRALRQGDDKYFSFELNINFTEINNPIITSTFDLVLLEAYTVLDEMFLYNDAPYIRAMKLNNIPCGDLVYEGNYITIGRYGLQATVSTALKNSLILGYSISFSAPNDVKVAEADDFYMKITRVGNQTTLNIIGFGNYKNSEYITLVLHKGTNNTDTWGLNTEDTVLKILRGGDIYYKTNLNEFFEYNFFNNNLDTKLSNTEYTYSFDIHEEGYFTIDIVFNDITKFNDIYVGNLNILVAEVAMQLDGSMLFYNNDPFIFLMRKNGASCGDPATQNSYITIDNLGSIV
jgi:lysophospholipase L1-like esterase